MGKYDLSFIDWGSSASTGSSYDLSDIDWGTTDKPEEEPSLLADLGRSYMAGSASIAEGAGYGLEMLGADTFGGWLRERARESRESWQSGYSDEFKAAQQKEFVTQDAEGDYSFGDAWTDPRAIGGALVQSVPGTMLGMGLGGALAKGFSIVPQIGPKLAGVLGYGTGEAAVASLSAGANTYEEVLRMPREVLEQSPEYQAALAGTGDESSARELIARAAGDDATSLTALTTFLLSSPAGAVLGKFTAGLPLATTRARSVALGFGAEGAQEFLQSGAEQLSQNIAIRDNADPTRDAEQGVLNQAVGGMFAGGLMGATVGAAAPLDQRPATPDPGAPPRARPTIDDIANDLRRPYADAAEEGANQARDIVARGGGDALSQELAASDVVYSAIIQSPTRDDVERTYGRQLQMLEVDEQLAQEAEAQRQQRLKLIAEDGEASVAWMSPGPDGQWRPTAEILPGAKSTTKRQAPDGWGVSVTDATGAVRAPKLRSPKRRKGRMDLLWQGQPNTMLEDPTQLEEPPAPAPRWEPTGNTVERVMADLSQDKDIGAALGTLTSTQALNIVQSPDQLPPEVQAALSESAETGAPQGLVYRGRMWLVADSIESGRARGVLLHEGHHYAIERPENSQTYRALQSNFERLLSEGDTNAVRAMQRVRGANTADVQNERVAYFLEEVVNNPEQASGRARMLAARVMQDVRLWFRETKVGKWLEANGAGFDLTPQEIVEIVKRSMIRQAQTPTAGGVQASRQEAGQPTQESRAGELAQSDAVAGVESDVRSEFRYESGRPRKTPTSNYVEPLSTYAPTVYRETNIEEADALLPGSNTTVSSDALYGMFASESPELALGQGRNTGVVVELDTRELKGQISRSKPTAEVAWQSGKAEFLLKQNSQSAVQNAVRSVTLKKDAAGPKWAIARTKAQLNRLVSEQGWTKEETDAGVVYRTPAMRAKAAEGLPQFSRRQGDVSQQQAEAFFAAADKVSRTEAISAAEEAWAGGVADFGDSEAAQQIQMMRGYFDYRGELADLAQEHLGNTFYTYRYGTQEFRDGIRDGDDTPPFAVTLSPVFAKRFKSFAGYDETDDVFRTWWRIKVDPSAIVMVGKESEYELVLDANAIEIQDIEQVDRLPEQIAETGVRFSRRQTETPEFKKWFGDSKVVDAEGRPLVVFHTSKARGISVFDPSYKTELSSFGFHFGTEDQAKFRAGQFDFIGAGETAKYYLSIKRPLRVSHMASFAPDHLADQLIDMGLLEDDAYADIQSEAGYDSVTTGDRLVAIMESAGYDGLVYENEREGAGDSFVAFAPTQIKSATGNSGAFDPTNPDIRYSRRQTDRPVPDTVRQAASLEASFEHVGSNTYARNRDLKVSLQGFVQRAARVARVDLTARTPEVKAHLVRAIVADSRYALRANENAIGWYDRTLKRALSTLSAIHPELETDEQARFAFTWALAVTSNGMKVDKNFELAEQAYAGYKATGRMPINVGEGTAAQAINDGLDMYNTLVDQLGEETVRKLMVTEFTVKELTEALGADITGELMDTRVRGAAILGPKIGNGFFSNLYGFYDALTMDRWLMRTWGRWTGTLIDVDPAKVADGRARLREVRDAVMADPAAKARLKELMRGTIPVSLDQFAKAVAKRTVKKDFRADLNEIEVAGWSNQKGDTAGAELRKAANSLNNALDGQKEAPGNGSERNWIREVFNEALTELKAQYPDLTMSDLQALLWYPEKKLYESSKTDETAEGYEEEAAPDYANAAAKLARKKGVDVNGRTAGTGSGNQSAAQGGQEQGRGFAPEERTAFLVDRFFDKQPADLVATQETQTLLTAAGRSAYDAFTQLAGRTDLRSAKARADYEKIQRQTMRKLAKRVGGQPSPLSQLISAVTGLSDAVLLGVDTNASGTFENVASPNMRLPLRFRSGKKVVVLTREQAEVILAVLGTELRQAAQAASSFKTVARGAEDTYSVLVEAPAGEEPSKSLLEQVSIDLGFPLSYARVPLGWQIDVNIGGFDTRPTIEQVGEVFTTAFGSANIHIVPRAYDSIYLEAQDYGDVLDAFQRAEDPGAGAGGSETDGRDGRMGRFRDAREAIRQIAEEQDQELAKWDAGVRSRIQFSRAAVSESVPSQLDEAASTQYTVQQGAKQAPDAVPPAKPLAEIEITDEYEIAETGETVSVTERADVRLRQLDKRLAVARRLVLCLGG